MTRLCIKCGERPARGSTVRCVPCLARAIDSQRARRAAWSADPSKCHRCGRPRGALTRRCEPCRQFRAENEARRLEWRRRVGICTECGARLVHPGPKDRACGVCRAAKNEKQTITRALYG